MATGSNILFIILLLSTTSHAAYLRIVQANVPYFKMQTGPSLRGYTTICPTNIFPKFTIECVSDKPEKGVATQAKFTWDRNLHMDMHAPFIMTLKKIGIATPWLHYRQRVKLQCVLDNEETTKADIYFDCKNRATKNVASSVKAPVEGSVQAPVQAPVETPPQQVINKTGCVKISATEYCEEETEAKGLWNVNGSAVAYKYNEYEKRTDKAGTSWLVYKFVAPVDGRYGLTLDWETSGDTDFNDVFLEFPAGGWRLHHKGESRDQDGWVKAYQNKNGRAMEAYSVDFKPHTFSTKRRLKAGTEYEVRLGGRSARVKVFSIIMFPCRRKGCEYGSEWNRSIETCST